MESVKVLEKSKEKMLVTQALDERDLLYKRIVDAIQRCNVVTTAKPNDKKTSTGVSVEDFEKEAKSQLQSITDLINRYERLDSAILLANATTTIEVAGKIMTRASAINLRKSLTVSNSLHQTDFRGMLISKLTDNFNEAKETIARTQAVANRQREVLVANISSSEKKEITDDALAGIETYCNNLVSSLVDPVDIDKRLKSLTEERDALVKNIESAIKISNATTYIEF